MKLTTRKKSTALAIALAGGVSTLLVGAVPAHAAPEHCGPTGDLVAPGVCEATFTSGSATFTPTAEMTALEALLVGAGGVGQGQSVATSSGYAAAGGGGEVKIVDLSGTTDPIDVTVPARGIAGSVTAGGTVHIVGNGSDGSTIPLGGLSGNGNPGAPANPGPPPYSAGGGAGASPDTPANGGAGVVVSSIAAAGSLFTGDTRCFGGGGAVGTPEPLVVGVPGCGAGGPSANANGVVAPLANSGGGGGAIAADVGDMSGASGIVIFRWNATDVAPDPDDEPVPGDAPARPTEIQTAREG